MDIPKTLATFGTRHKTKQNTHNTENVKGKQLTPAMLLIVYIYIYIEKKHFNVKGKDSLSFEYGYFVIVNRIGMTST